MSTNIGCNQWLSLAKPTLKVAHAGRNRSLVAHTSKCGRAIRKKIESELDGLCGGRDVVEDDDLLTCSERRHLFKGVDASSSARCSGHEEGSAHPHCLSLC